MQSTHANQDHHRPAVETVGLTKRFGDRTAVDGVGLVVPRGAAYGFLGHNGAGKTTLIRMLLGLTRASEGSASLFGLPVPAERAEALARVGAIVEAPSFYPHLTGRENLAIAAAIRGPETRTRIDQVLHRVGLDNRSGDRVGTYSLGMRQRLGVARCPLSDPALRAADLDTGWRMGGGADHRRGDRQFLVLPGEIIPKLALFAIAWVVGDNVRTRREYLTELEARAARLEHEREEQLRRAAAEERTRISRELHDMIAHNVSVMVVQASAGEEVFDADPARARESLSAVASTGRAALAELRRLLGVIRADSDRDGGASYAPQPGIEYLDELLGQVRETGLAVQLSVLGEPRKLPNAVDLCAYRIIQEALTNTLKPTDASQAQVSLRYLADALELQVLDDGRGETAPNAEPGGHGLIGMHERVALFGGELTAEPRAVHGYAVRARLPLGEPNR
jgi:signal transduction histidine kinase